MKYYFQLYLAQHQAHQAQHEQSTHIRHFTCIVVTYETRRTILSSCRVRAYVYVSMSILR